MPRENDGRISPELTKALADLGRRNLYFFAKWILGFKDMVPEIHGRAARLLMDPDLKKLATIMPRGFFKSSLWSIAYPIWESVRNPNVRILICQNTYANAIKKLQSISHHFLENDLFRSLYREILPTPKCIWRTDSMHVTRSSHEPEGTFEAAGTNTKTISRHYDIIIEDDTVAPEKSETGEDAIAPSSEQVELAIGLHQLLVGLQNHPTESRRLVVGTRWFEHDLLSWIRDREKSYVFYERAALENEAGESDYDGEPTFPSRFSRKALEQLEETCGRYIFSCLYMNKPQRPEDMVFKPEYFQYYDKLPANLVTYTTVDPAGDPTENLGRTDWNVVITCGKDLRTGYIYVLSYTRFQGNPGELIDHIIEHQKVHRPVRVGVETVAYQKSILYYLRERKKQEFLIFPVESITNTKKSKVMRIMGLEPVFKHRKIFLGPWMHELKKELLAFPRQGQVHDDVIDALSMQLEMWRSTPSPQETEAETEKAFWSVDNAIKELEERAQNDEDPRFQYSVENSYYDLPSNSRRAASAILSDWARRRGERPGSPAHLGPGYFN